MKPLRAMARVSVLGVLLAGCGRHATQGDCTAMLDRYVELLVREQNPGATAEEIAQQKERTHEKAAHDVSFASCPSEVKTKDVACALAAPNVDEFEKCLE
jgi:hypothetical protein